MLPESAAGAAGCTVCYAFECCGLSQSRVVETALACYISALSPGVFYATGVARNRSLLIFRAVTFRLAARFDYLCGSQVTTYYFLLFPMNDTCPVHHPVLL